PLPASKLSAPADPGSTSVLRRRTRPRNFSRTPLLPKHCHPERSEGSAVIFHILPIGGDSLATKSCVRRDKSKEALRLAVPQRGQTCHSLASTPIHRNRAGPIPFPANVKHLLPPVTVRSFTALALHRSRYLRMPSTISIKPPRRRTFPCFC